MPLFFGGFSGHQEWQWLPQRGLESAAPVEGMEAMTTYPISLMPRAMASFLCGEAQRPRECMSRGAALSFINPELGKQVFFLPNLSLRTIFHLYAYQTLSKGFNNNSLKKCIPYSTMTKEIFVLLIIAILSGVG
jgi:hypothetical protein